ncbi:Phospholipid-transporting ATPase IA [Balamuthia mandrillaris]
MEKQKEKEEESDKPPQHAPPAPSQPLHHHHQVTDVNHKKKHRRTSLQSGGKKKGEWGRKKDERGAGPGGGGGNGRVVYVNDQRRNSGLGYPTNRTTTTKYTWWSFIFLNLYEQFRRVANFYFLIVCIIELVPDVAPLTPWTSILPLAFVLFVTALKDGIDDYRRRKADKEVNSKLSKVMEKDLVRDTIHWVDRACEAIAVGDVIRVNEGEELPADIVLLKSGGHDEQCYIETSNLDGEANKKIKRAVPLTANMSNEELYALEGVLHCEEPNIHLDSFHATFSHKPIPSSHRSVSALTSDFSLHSLSQPRPSADDSNDSLQRKRRLKMQQRMSRTVTRPTSSSRRSSTAREFTCPLNASHLLPRGSRLVSTPYVIGVVAYTGRDTKLVLNQKSVPLKFSQVERTMNKLLWALIVFVVILCGIGGILNVWWEIEEGIKAKYLMLPRKVRSTVTSGFKEVMTFFVLLNVFVPISLYVTLEFVKFFQSRIIEFDPDLYCPRSKQSIIVKTTALLEQLGQIDYVFTDKTGTLTQNKLKFRRCCIGSRMFYAGTAPNVIADGTSASVASTKDKVDEEAHQQTVSMKSHELPLQEHANDEEVVEFLIAIALCNTVFVDNVASMRDGQSEDEREEEKELSSSDDEKPQFSTLRDQVQSSSSVPCFQASSPDEEALVKAAMRYGVTLVCREHSIVTLNVQGEQRDYEVLAELPFDNDRKRMSVIVSTPDGDLKLYCKGAESMVFPRVRSSSKEDSILLQVSNAVDYYASMGLRTLAVASSTLQRDSFSRWFERYEEACMAINEREAKIAAVAEDIEQQLSLLGASAVEDKLQEGVPQTLESLRQAGINIWVLTGDKQETAVNIGYSSQVLDSSMKLLYLTNCVTVEACGAQLKRLRSLEDIDDQSDAQTGTSASAQHSSGVSRLFSSLVSCRRYRRKQTQQGTKTDTNAPLALIVDGTSLKHALSSHKQTFLRLSEACKAVICCRVSPKQKAKVVELIKGTGHTTLAIGDGANDVSMIREAHVGIGIVGREGSQASRSSDYAIPQFRFLNKLLLVHGRYAYVRIATLVQYFFYKNAVFTLPQFFYSFYDGFSGQTLFDAWIITLFNMAFTSFPIILVGLLDKDVPEKLLFRYPQLYARSQGGRAFNFKTYFWWNVSAVIHASFAFFVTIYALSSQELHHGHPFDLMCLGTTISTVVVLVVTLKLALETNNWTWIHHLLYWGSIIVYFVFLLVYSVLPFAAFGMYWVPYMLLRAPVFWITVLLLVPTALLFDFAAKSFMALNFPEDWQKVNEYYQHRGQGSAKKIKKGGATSRRPRSYNRLPHHEAEPLLKEASINYDALS